MDEVIKVPESLPHTPTLSHIQWGTYLGFNENGRYVIETAEKQRLAFV